MIVTLTERSESLLKEQVAQGGYASVDAAIEAAVQSAFGRRATAALEGLLDAAMTHPGRRVPVAELRTIRA